MEGVHPRVEAEALVDVLLGGAVVPDQPDGGGEGVVVGQDRARVAVRAEVLAGVEAGGGDPAPEAVAVLPAGALGLRAVLDDRSAAGQLEQGPHGGELAVEVDGQQGDGVRECVGDPLRVDQEVFGVGVHQDGPQTGPDHGLGGGDEGVGGQHHAAAGGQAEGAQGEFEGVGAVGDADAVAGAAERGVVGLEALHHRPFHVAAGGEHPVEPGADVLGDLGVCGPQIHERNRCVGGRHRLLSCPSGRWLGGSVARWLSGSMARWLDGSVGRPVLRSARPARAASPRRHRTSHRTSHRASHRSAAYRAVTTRSCWVSVSAW